MKLFYKKILKSITRKSIITIGKKTYCNTDSLFTIILLGENNT